MQKTRLHRDRTPRVIDLDAMSFEEKLAHYSAKIRRGIAGELGSMFAAKDVTESIYAVIDLKIEAAINTFKSDMELKVSDMMDDKLNDFDDKINKRGRHDPEY